MNCLEYYEAYAAAEYGATILVPLNYRLAPPEIVHVLRDSGARGLIFEERYAATVAQIRPQLPDVGFYVQIGAAADGALEYEALLADGDEAGPPVRPQPHDYSVLWYTSGTTGKPKGVPWRHRALVETARMNARQSEMSRATRLLQTTPSFHIGGRGYVLGTAYDGGCTVLHKAFDPVAMLRTIQDERITHTFMVAAMVQAVLAVPDVQSYDLSSLENVFSAAAPIPVPVLKRAIELMGPVFSIQYGCTEVGGICAHAAPGGATRRHARRRAAPGVGRPSGAARSSSDSSTTRVRIARRVRPARSSCARRLNWTDTGTIRRRRSMRSATAGTTPATSACRTSRATCSWSTARRT